ncbi:conserved hypothetical protein [Deferribacter desulfuricans SSM1]|uniref:DsrE family protein n=1 Tax=Deferribacter desulfuricans (strain DSM 14783 / JCM 11476 / NBRC 101012 / SSM1) TaxID=639282 RepID=D3PDE4_DEFDS|nr:hypothetical protein [Deferribacter desulfuricans]BAI80617.1 conserved hypothetical protein [Deferribacter desulfuricans SSM1]
MAKILIWLASGEKEKLNPGILYGTNAKKYGWVDDVKFVVFGEAEKLMLEDEELFSKIQDNVETVYCKFVAEEMNITKDLESKGAKVIYVGEYISNLLKEGYQVLTF